MTYLLPEQLRAWRLRQHGTFVQHRRPVQGWSQKMAASWYGVHERTWQRWEEGEVPIPKHVARRIAAFGNPFTQESKQ